MKQTNCPEKNDLNLFLNGEKTSSEREVIELHLSDCADCRTKLSAAFAESFRQMENFKAPENLVERVKSLPEKKPENRRGEEPAGSLSADAAAAGFGGWFRQNFLQLGFAAVLLVFVGLTGVYFLRNEPVPSVGDTLRDGSSVGGSIRLLAPENNASVRSQNISFRWTAAKDAVSYTFILSGDKGDIIYQTKTEQTEIRLPENIINKDSYYFWQVKTRLADSRLLESEVRKIVMK